jgi:TolB-like protein
MSFLGEIKRRRVLQVAAIYAVTAWLLVQIVATVEAPLRLPEWVDTLIIVLLAVGFPIALILAWAFELTPEGIKRDDDERRPTSAGAVSHRRLDIIIIGILAAAVVFLLFNTYVLDNGRGDSAAIKPVAGTMSIAVLPLEIFNNDPDKEYLADGMTASLITELSKIEALRVISRTSIQKYKDSAMSLPDIARELNVGAVIEGSVLSVGDTVRVSASLIPAEQDSAVWSQTYDRDIGDVLALHSEIAHAIARQVQITLTAADEARLVPASPIDAEVQEAILRGRFLFYQSNGTKGLDLLQKATVLAPDYARGWVALARSYASLATDDPAFLGQAKVAAARAMELDDTLSDSHYVVGNIAFYQDWDWELATRELKRALDLNPGNESAMQVLGDYYELLGEWSEAIELGIRSKQSNPVSAGMRMNLGFTYNYAERYKEALAECLSALELSPASAWAHICLADSKMGLGLLEEAAAAAEEAIRLAPNEDIILGLASFVFGATGRVEKVATIHRLLEQESQTRYVSPYALAMTALNKGDNEAAITFLELAVEEKATYTPWINSYPGFERMRSMPRFQALIESLHLPAS